MLDNLYGDIRIKADVLYRMTMIKTFRVILRVTAGATAPWSGRREITAGG